MVEPMNTDEAARIAIALEKIASCLEYFKKAEAEKGWYK